MADGPARFRRINVKASILSGSAFPGPGFFSGGCGAIMYSKFLVLLVAAAALSGCCVSGSGCYAPTPGTPLAWDGLGEPPTTADGVQPGEARQAKRRVANRSREIVLGPLNSVPANGNPSNAKAAYDEWTRLPNEDPDADARLKRQIKICQNC
jgi:hypothetical protein